MVWAKQSWPVLVMLPRMRRMRVAAATTKCRRRPAHRPPCPPCPPAALPCGYSPGIFPRLSGPVGAARARAALDPAPGRMLAGRLPCAAPLPPMAARPLRRACIRSCRMFYRSCTGSAFRAPDCRPRCRRTRAGAHAWQGRVRAAHRGCPSSSTGRGPTDRGTQMPRTSPPATSAGASPEPLGNRRIRARRQDPRNAAGRSLALSLRRPGIGRLP